jgi:adenylate kinase
MSEQFQIPHLSTGEILRAATAEESAIGREAAQYMGRGELVPNEMIQEIVFQELSKPACERGYIPGHSRRRKNSTDGWPSKVAPCLSC